MPIRLLALLVACLFLLVACENDSGGTTTSVAPPPTGDGTTSTQTAPDTQPPETAPSTTLPEGTEDLPEEIRTDLAELIAVAEEVRGLDFQEPPNVAVVTSEELAERVREQLTEDLEDLPADQALYRLLGLIDDDLDLESLYTDLYSEQVAGFYDGEEGELVVPRAEEGFTALQRATLVHELTHALTDQHFGFHDRYTALFDENRFDRAAAFQALIEGDAVLTQILYLRTLSAEEQAQFFNESFGVDQQVFESAPQFIREALRFPYDSGLLFVDRLYQTGGYGAIADAYAEPPTSTEQIIDPADYPADEPVPLDVEPLTVEGYDLEYQSRWGELSFALMFDQVLDADISDTAAGGWGGDTYQVHFDGEEIALVLHYRGDAESDGAEMADALDQYVETAMDVGEAEEFQGGNAYRGEDAAWVSVDGANVVFVATSQAELLDSVVESTAGGGGEGT